MILYVVTESRKVANLCIGLELFYNLTYNLFHFLIFFKRSPRKSSKTLHTFATFLPALVPLPDSLEDYSIGCLINRRVGILYNTILPSVPVSPKWEMHQP